MDALNEEQRKHKTQEAEHKETKSEIARREEAVLAFWEEHQVFEKSLAKPSPKGEFVFYDGPPFANGVPHYGSLLSSIIKDVIPRYKTMRGYYVRRRWGWDCHGLPIESEIEKQLHLKTKKDIEEMGVAKFNETCRSVVLRYVDLWRWYVGRVGRWVDFENSYKTMDVTYMESVWWALKEMDTKSLLYEGRKVLLYCPRCETPLAKAEIAMDDSYRDVTEEAVTVKFKVKNPEKHDLPQNTYLLAWTTTPWTLPGNVALAVGPEITYEQTSINNETLIHATASGVVSEGKQKATMKGRELVGLEYEPLYEIEAVRNSGKKVWYVAPADFVTTEEGTGIVHTAVIYGEDDYQLGLKLDLPMVPLLDASGQFNDQAPEFIRGVYIKKAEEKIKEDLKGRNLLFSAHNHTHSYPHCYRCGMPLIYNALTSWFVNIQKVKKRLLRLNKKVNWYPEHLKYGRFYNILESAPDWTISRNRYWASPLPIWKCEKCHKVKVIGSVDELKKRTKISGNQYFVMRHGESEGNTKGTVNYLPEVQDGLTEKGKEEVRSALRKIRSGEIDVVITSPLQRTKETAQMVLEHLGFKEDQLIIDKQLGEVCVGDFQGKTWGEYHDAYSAEEQFVVAPSGGETRAQVKKRAGDILYELERKYKNKKILLVTHEGVYEMFLAVVEGADRKRSIELVAQHAIKNAEIKHLPFVPLPHDQEYVLDLHRPYIDDSVLLCNCGADMRRIPEVVDGWFESGSMPFAEYHYPFDNKRVFRQRFPGDFIVEYIAQTRTWFYYMHAVAGTLFRKPSFKNVLTTGNILGSDGRKMSKSFGNYTDPKENIDRYGADALRYYLATSVVMQAEDVTFSDDDLKEVHNRLINILWNVFKFYETYAGEYDGVTRFQETGNILDRWIISRLGELIPAVTEGLEVFNTVSAGRPVRDFITDLSTWYIRRSRERFKTDKSASAEAMADKQVALATTRFVLLELAKVMAPFTPFIAEDIYRRVGGPLESVHLETWPSGYKLRSTDHKLLNEMAEVRRIVSRALESRTTAGIKVRQPLARLKIRKTEIDIRSNEQLLRLIRDEVNVKEVVFEDATGWEVELDTAITPELKAEGRVRELIRAIQNLRKDGGLTPGDMAVLEVETDDAGRALMEQFMDGIQNTALLKNVQFTKVTGEKVVVDNLEFILAIKK